MNAPLSPTVIHTRHVLAVQDLALSAGYFREQLGFTRDFVVEGWEFLSLGGFKVMLGECRDAVPASATGDHSYFAHVLVADVDALFEEHRRRGAKFLFEVQDKPWSLREYGVVTPDVLIRDDGTKIIPREETLDSVKQRFSDVTVEDRGKGRLSVSGGGLKWSFQEGEKEPQLVQALWREDWKVLNTENGRELSFPCSLKDVLHVLGRDCKATDHRGREIELPD